MHRLWLVKIFSTLPFQIQWLQYNRPSFYWCMNKFYNDGTAAPWFQLGRGGRCVFVLSPSPVSWLIDSEIVSGINFWYHSAGYVHKIVHYSLPSLLQSLVALQPMSPRWNCSPNAIAVSLEFSNEFEFQFCCGRVSHPQRLKFWKFANTCVETLELCMLNRLLFCKR